MRSTMYRGCRKEQVLANRCWVYFDFFLLEVKGHYIINSMTFITSASNEREQPQKQDCGCCFVCDVELSYFSFCIRNGK